MCLRQSFTSMMKYDRSKQSNSIQLIKVFTILFRQIFWVNGHAIANYTYKPTNCIRSEHETRVAFPQWPFRLDCDRMVEKISPENFRIHNNGSCWSKYIRVEMGQLARGSTFENINSDVMNNRSVIYKQMRFNKNKQIRFHCPPNLNKAKELPYLFALPPDYNTTVWRTRRNNVSGTLQNGTVLNYTAYTELLPLAIARHSNGSQVIFKFGLTYFDPGVYSCELQHGDERVFLSHESICVAASEPDPSPPNINCQKFENFVPGQDFSISCKVFNSSKMIDRGQLIVNWQKNDSSGLGCQYRYGNTVELSPSNERYSCSIGNFSNLPSLCFNHVPSDEEIINYPSRKEFTINFRIKNAQSYDAGRYDITVRYKNQISESFAFTLDYDRQFFTIDSNRPSDSIKSIHYHVITVVFLVLTVLVTISIPSIIIWYKWIQILLFIRRHWRKYDKDDKKYVALFSYLFSDNLSKSTREATQKIVRYLEDKMKELNYTFYDSHSEIEPESAEENLLKFFDDSHCVIVILTDAYVNERLSRFEAQQTFLNMLENPTKFILIWTPEATKVFKQTVQNKNDFSFKLNVAIKASQNIAWSERMSESKFKDHVEYALPKIKCFQTENKC